MARDELAYPHADSRFTAIPRRPFVENLFQYVGQVLPVRVGVSDVLDLPNRRTFATNRRLTPG